MNGLFNQERYREFEREMPFDFAKHSSIGCGGSAKLAFYPKTIEECCRLLGCLQQDKIEYTLIGNLSNVLPAENIKKVLINTKKMSAIRIIKENKIFAEAGVMSGKLLAFARNTGLGGLEFLIGIPCTLGGALYMNAGVSGRYISERVESVLVYREGAKVEIPVAECEYAYKHSLFMRTGESILGATLRLTKTTLGEIKKAEAFYRDRRAHLPKGKSMGCVFKNPDGVSAGALIERADLKGLRIGGAYVSEEHANFIINDGTATPKEIFQLIQTVKKAVYQKSGILLEEEIRYLE